jgi:hypothetical protein
LAFWVAANDYCIIEFEPAVYFVCKLLVLILNYLIEPNFVVHGKKLVANFLFLLQVLIWDFKISRREIHNCILFFYFELSMVDVSFRGTNLSLSTVEVQPHPKPCLSAFYRNDKPGKSLS